jgi:hypothetical protein
MAKMRVVIYLSGDDDGKLDDCEKQCSEHAERFGWQVLASIHRVNRCSSRRVNAKGAL